MAFLTSEPISALAVALLRRSLVLANTVSRVPAPDFAGPSGGTVKVRVPRTRTARQQAAPGDDITYDAVVEDETGSQVLLPQVAAIATQAEDILCDAMLDTPAASGHDGTTIQWAASPDPDSDLATVLAAREKLTTNKVPAAGRYLACAPDVVTRLLSVPTFVQADRRGDGGNALDSAIVGQVFGLTVLESAGLSQGSAIAYHQSGFALANVAPAEVTAGADSTVASDSGLQLRTLLGYSPDKLSSVSVVSVFGGASIVEDQGAVSRALLIATA